MVRSMNLSLEAELEYRRAQLVRSGHNVWGTTRGARRAAARAERAAATARRTPAATPQRATTPSRAA
jgi:hypothetical protein